MKVTVKIKHTGITLVELIATIVLLGFGLAIFTNMLIIGLQRSGNAFDEIRTTALAQAYLDEILSRRFDENSHPSGTPTCYLLVGPKPCSDSATFGAMMDPGEGSRNRFDDVDDYHNLDEGTDSPSGDLILSDADDTDRIGYEGFRVLVTVEYAGDDPPINKDPTDAKLITVTVFEPTRSNGTEFSAYKVNF
ncbi:MAG: MSHA pilin protein MshD [Pseudohongiellaceae bacterium]|jgi:MSHA pilin protein MshD